MTPEQRYWFDLTGYLHIKSALSPEELIAAQEAAKRYMQSDPDNLPDGFAIEENRHTHGFAYDKALERLALHPTTWPIVKEITRNRPRLTSGTLQVNIPGRIDKAQRLHCARDDYGWDAIRYDVRDGKVFCDHIVVFPYLTDVNPGDGGLLVVPGSHKSMFDRPPAMFHNGLIEDLNDLPEGVVNVTPKAGDIVIINELVTHGVLPWTPKDRNRMILVLRYQPQYKGGDFPDAIKKRLSPETCELIAKGSYKDRKAIVDQEFVTLTI